MKQSTKERLDTANERAHKWRVDKYQRQAATYGDYLTTDGSHPDGMIAARAATKTLGKSYAAEEGAEVPVDVIGINDVGSAFDFTRYRKNKTRVNEGAWFFFPLRIEDLISLAEFLNVLQDDPHACAISGAISPDAMPYLHHPLKRRWHETARSDAKQGGVIVPRSGYWRALEIDKLKLPAGMKAHELDRVIGFVAEYLEQLIGQTSFCYQWSSSHGIGGPDDDCVSVHIWFRSKQLIDSKQWHGISTSMKRVRSIDPAVAIGTAVVFTARPEFRGADGGLKQDFLEDTGSKFGRVGIHWSDADEADLSSWIEADATATKARLERARIAREKAREYADTLEADEIVDAYATRWEAYAAKFLGDGPGRSGYYNGIYALFCEAIESGETVPERAVSNVIEFVTDFADARGELEDRGRGKNALATYLVFDTLCQRFDDALNKVLGVGDHEQQE